MVLHTHKSTKVMEFLLDIFRQLSLDVIWSNLRPTGEKGLISFWVRSVAPKPERGRERMGSPTAAGSPREDRVGRRSSLWCRHGRERGGETRWDDRSQDRWFLARTSASCRRGASNGLGEGHGRDGCERICLHRRARSDDHARREPHRSADHHRRTCRERSAGRCHDYGVGCRDESRAGHCYGGPYVYGPGSGPCVDISGRGRPDYFGGRDCFEERAG